jgi:hypothetical protein
MEMLEWLISFKNSMLHMPSSSSSSEDHQSRLSTDLLWLSSLVVVTVLRVTFPRSSNKRIRKQEKEVM